METARSAEASQEKVTALLSRGMFEQALEALDQAPPEAADDPVLLNSQGAALCGLGRLDEAREAFGRALELERGFPLSVCNLLNLALEQRNHPEFISTYRRLRPFLSLSEGAPYDRMMADLLSKAEMVGDAAVRRDLGLILFQQGSPRARSVLESLPDEQRNSPRVALTLALLDLYAQRPPADLNRLAEILPPRQHQELTSCLEETLSPTLLRNLDALMCLKCGGRSLEPAGDHSALTCPSCGRSYEVREGVPLLLAEPIEAYHELEKSYWKSFTKEKNPICTPPGLETYWRTANMPGSFGPALDNKARLKTIYYGEEHWNRLLAFFRRHTAGRTDLKVLDIGSATGNDIYALSRLFPEFDYFGVEVVLPGACVSQAYHGAQPNQFICADASQALPFAAESFDIVISNCAIEHCRGRMMDETHRILKPGGTAFITGPSQKSYMFLSLQGLGAYAQSVDRDQYFATHGLSPEEYGQMLAKFEILEHASDRFFFRLLLEDDLINKMRPQAAEALYREFCGILGQALEDSPEARWYNYIQMFTLRKA